MQGVREGILVLLGVCLLSCVLAEETLRGVKQNTDGTGEIRFETPTLDDEEAHSSFMPDSLRCDACRILAYKFQQNFEAAHKKRPNLKRLPESEYVDQTEAVCNDKFENIGLKVVEGKKRLSGPGLETQDVPGIMQGGGKWPLRMQQQCSLYLGELEEEQIYEGFLQHRAKLEDFLCYGHGLTGACTQPPPRDEL